VKTLNSSEGARRALKRESQTGSDAEREAEGARRDLESEMEAREGFSKCSKPGVRKPQHARSPQRLVVGK